MKRTRDIMIILACLVIILPPLIEIIDRIGLAVFN